jgi:hypothetical protein
MGILLNGLVKTTLEIPDELFRAAKAKAALEGVKLKDLFAEGLRLRVEQPRGPARFVKFPIIKSRAKRPLNIPDDIASRIEVLEDLKKNEASVR